MISKPCFQCKKTFTISDEDLNFYEKISPQIGGKIYRIPPPKLCPQCRLARRLAFRNERSLYHRKCDLTGRQIISIFSPDKPFTVYSHEEWWSDKWDPMEYGRDFDFERPFFDQWRELALAVPKPSLYLQADNVNCQYTNLTSYNKNSYLIFAASENEDCYYCTYLHRSKNVADCLFIFDSELCYECVDCYRCYELSYSQYCDSCHSSYFLADCKGCSDCFGCIALVNKKFHIFNKPYSQKEYLKKVHDMLSSKTAFEEAKKRFFELEIQTPHKYYAGLQNESVMGDHISFSKNAKMCYDCTHLEDCKYCTWLHESKNCYDCYAWGMPGELGYENHLCGNGFYNVKFSEACWNNIADLTYCHLCMNASKNLFGCVGLKKKEYCILNKQYTPQKYFEMVANIIDHMRKTEEWGEFFPMSLSPFDYHETVAQTYFPLPEKEILRKQVYMGPTWSFPWNISEIDDSICDQILTCETTGRPYKIIPQELKFYRQMGLPLPRKCPDERHALRLALRNPRKLWSHSCHKCGKAVETSYAPDRQEIIYCEECYLKEVY